MFTLERLEDRMLLAAQVSQVGGTLTITGDNGDDALIVVGTGGPGQVEVLADTDGDGLADDSLGSFTGVKNLTINTKGGDDDVAVVNAGLSGNVSINTGAGNDTAMVLDSLIGGNATFNTGNGTDIASLGSLEFGTGVGGKVTINTGAGNDGVSLYNLTLYGPLSVNTGGGQDYVELHEASVSLSDPVTLNGGGGTDYLAGESIAALEQQLAQVGAKLNGFEFHQDRDNVPADVLNPLVLQVGEHMQKLGMI
jgi:hypothetical protein